jgi:DNA-binding HxlR family transcriptional regulator
MLCDDLPMQHRTELHDALGEVERRSYDESPLRVEYSATQKGEALRPVFAVLSEWGESDAHGETADTAD